jgi:hypothetical protein
MTHERLHERTNGAHDPHERTHEPRTQLPLGEAAALLGLSRDALRMRIARGTVPSERRAGVWYVPVAALDATIVRPRRAHARTVRTIAHERANEAHDQPARSHDQDHADPPEQSDLLAHVLAENTYLRNQLAEMSHRLAEAHQLLAMEKQRQLAAPLDTVTTRVEAGEKPLAPADPTQRVSTPWWRFWGH